jgi:signal transduction histidine kinase/ligand-binding sensor domain-containing protein/class 3 adenylate cyclase/CheY-like chemotaxis protein
MIDFKRLVALMASLCLLFSLAANANRDSISFQHINTEQGLPQSTVNTVFQDSHGFIWIGTFDGLTRYDGYSFVNFKNNPLDSNSLSNNIVVSIIEDELGFLWVGTKQNGINRFDPNTGKFTRFLSQLDDFDSLNHPQVNVIHQDTMGRIWVGTNGGLNLFVPEKQAFAHFTNNPLDDQSLPDGAIVDIIDDGNGNLWVASNHQLAHFDIEQQIFSRFNQNVSPNQINTLYLDTDNSLWVGTQSDGLYHLRPDKAEFENIQALDSDPNSLSSNHVRSILRVRSGDLWIGTEEGGLNIRRKGATDFQHVKRNSADRHSLAINDIWSLYQDKSGLIWVGTAGGGINTTMSFENRLSRLTHAPFATNGLSHEFVWDIEEDKLGNIWFATLAGLDSYSPETDEFTYLKEFFDENNQPISNRIQTFIFDQQERIWFGNQQGQVAVYDPKTKISKIIQRPDFPHDRVSYHRIRLIDQDRSGTIWVSTEDGLLRIDPQTLQITHNYHFAEQGQLGESVVRTMLQDESGIIWFGTWDKGLQRYDPEFTTITNFENDPLDKHSISNNTVRSLYIDSQGNLWVGTFNGLNFLSAESIQNKTFEFKSYLEKDGLPNSAIYGISAGSNGNLWVSTNKGISEFNPNTKQFQNYNIDDGLTTNEFNGNAVTRSQNGEIYFGSVNGVTIINPSSRTQTDFKPQIKITEILISGQTNAKKSILPRGVPYKNQSINLEHNLNDLTFEFAALDYRHPNRNQFQYRLLPYNKDWVKADNNQAVFTNLDPNQYTFELRATNSDGVWVEKSTNLQFTIIPPLWKTWWAYLLYLAVLIALLAYYFNKQERSLQEQRAINEHLRKVDQLKDEFLANTSHELRTPLNGIIGLAESLKEGIAGLQNQKTLTHLQLIIDGGKRLSQLVNDILDFKKLSHNKLILQRKAADLSSIVDVVVSLLLPLANEKKLTITNSVRQDLPLIYADENRVQQILHNLIGNAIKYTKVGSIEVSASLKNNFVEIKVSDTGIGVEDSQLELILEPFEQAELQETISHRGTGLGLSVSKQLIEEHGGSLWVKSQVDKGSQFYFDIPVWLEDIHEAQQIECITQAETIILHNKKPVNQKSQSAELTHTKQSANKGKILIADDDPINLEVLTGLLEMNGYSVKSARDGVQAVTLGLGEEFDLAILDIMMPGMSGYEVCKTLRQKHSPIELPILLLSARNQPGDISAGFEAGANDYVTKPIEREVLLSRIHTMRLIGGLVEAKQQKEHAATLQKACERMGKYFPKQMVKQIITNDHQSPLVAKRKQVTVLFADLAGFTAISDRFEPEAITQILNSFLGKMGALIENRQGVLNEILGDGLVVLFGALDNMDKQLQARSAVELALEMQAAMKILSDEWLDAGFDHNVKLRIGIHQDYVTAGNFGSQDIVAFRAVGSGVNLASRLENYSQPGQVTVSYPVYVQCREAFNFSELEEVEFKGFNHPHRVCQLLDKKTNPTKLD